jgi:uncharacterized protein YecT (DUF1311 family)
VKTNLEPHRIVKYSRRRSALVLCSVLWLAGTSINAQKPKKPDPCANPQTQTEMTQCAAEAYKAADKVLNQVYQQLVAKLDDEEKAQLKEAQTAWLKYRDTNCDFVADQYKGGTMRPMIYAGCLADVTKNRTSELREQIKDRSH